MIEDVIPGEPWVIYRSDASKSLAEVAREMLTTCVVHCIQTQCIQRQLQMCSGTFPNTLRLEWLGGRVVPWFRPVHCVSLNTHVWTKTTNAWTCDAVARRKLDALAGVRWPSDHSISLGCELRGVMVACPEMICLA